MKNEGAKQMNFSNIADIDKGKVALVLNHALRQIFRDCQDRPGDKGKRKVVFTITATPVVDKDTNAHESTDLKFSVDARLPIRVSSDYPMVPAQDGTLLFQPHSPKDPRQMPLPMGSDDERPRRRIQVLDDGTRVDAETGEEIDDNGGSETSPM